jgi:putative transposase
MQTHNLLLARKYTERPEHVHNGKVIVMRSNLRCCSDGFEFTCWNGDIVRGAFIIDAHDREIIAWRAVVNAGISGSEIRDIMLEAVERRFGTYRAPSLFEMLTNNGSPYIAKETQVFARQLGLKPCFTPVQSPQSNGMSEAFWTCHVFVPPQCSFRPLGVRRPRGFWLPMLSADGAGYRSR